MPYRAILTATTPPPTVPPADTVPRVLPVTVDAADDLWCPVCGDPLTVRRAHDRQDTAVARHFIHLRETDCPGESDVHSRLKSLAADTLARRFPAATVTVEETIPVPRFRPTPDTEITAHTAQTVHTADTERTEPPESPSKPRSPPAPEPPATPSEPQPPWTPTEYAGPTFA